MNDNQTISRFTQAVNTPSGLQSSRGLSDIDDQGMTFRELIGGHKNTQPQSESSQQGRDTAIEAKRAERKAAETLRQEKGEQKKAQAEHAQDKAQEKVQEKKSANSGDKDVAQTKNDKLEETAQSSAKDEIAKKDADSAGHESAKDQAQGDADTHEEVQVVAEDEVVDAEAELEGVALDAELAAITEAVVDIDVATESLGLDGVGAYVAEDEAEALLAAGALEKADAELDVVVGPATDAAGFSLSEQASAVAQSVVTATQEMREAKSVDQETQAELEGDESLRPGLLSEVASAAKAKAEGGSEDRAQPLQSTMRTAIANAMQQVGALAQSKAEVVSEKFGFAESGPKAGAIMLESRSGQPAVTQYQSDSARAAAALQTAVKTPVGQPQWTKAVGDRVLWMAAQNVKVADMHLNPADLGPMQVRITVNQEQASVSFTSQHAVVREALDQGAFRLREMFDEQGMNLVDVDVSDQSMAQQSKEGGDERKGAKGSSEADEETVAEEVAVSGSLALVDHYV